MCEERKKKNELVCSLDLLILLGTFWLHRQKKPEEVKVIAKGVDIFCLMDVDGEILFCQKIQMPSIICVGSARCMVAALRFSRWTGYGIASSSIKMWQMTGMHRAHTHALIDLKTTRRQVSFFISSLLSCAIAQKHTHTHSHVYHFSIAFEMTIVWSIWPGKCYSSGVQTMK